MFPKIALPSFTETVPSTEAEITLRPYVAREEKVFLMAKGGSDKEVIQAIKSVVGACVIAPSNFDVNKLTLTDLEWLFLRLAARSVEETTEVTYSDPEDKKTRTFNINLLDVKQISDAKKLDSLKMIDVPGGIKIQLRQPTAEITNDLTDTDKISAVMKACIDRVWEGEQVFPADEADPKELAEFCDSLPSPTTRAIREYLDALPRLQYKIEYQNDAGTKREIVLNRLQDFFRLA